MISKMYFLRGVLLAGAMGMFAPVAGCSRCRKAEEAKVISCELGLTPVGNPEPPHIVECPGPQYPSIKRVYFGFDQSTIGGDQLSALEHDLNLMRADGKGTGDGVGYYRDMRFLIEGHCDERGTTEYNYSLGEKRARAVADYLIAGGIAPERIVISSKGEECPFDPGHDEAAWAKNRRVEFLFIREKK